MIDARIPLSVFANQPDIGEIYGRFAQLRNLAQKQKSDAIHQQMQELQLRDLQQQQQDQQSQRGAYNSAYQQGQSVPSTTPAMSLGAYTLPASTTNVQGPGIDNGVLLSKLGQAGQAQAIPAIQQQMEAQAAAKQKHLLDVQLQIANIAKTQGEAGLNKLKQAQSTMQIVGQYGKAVLQAPPEVRPQVYQQVRQQAAQNGLPVNDLPEQYSPEVDAVLQAHVAEAQSVKDAIANELTKRGQDTTAATAKAGQAVTMRGQNMTDKRSREANANAAHGTFVQGEDGQFFNPTTGELKAAPAAFKPLDKTGDEKLYKDVIAPAQAKEQSYQMFQGAYQDYKNGAKTGAPSMVALSTHLSTTFGNVKGARITKDMIHEHLGARSVSDGALAAIQKLTNGDVLSPDQWEDFRGLIKNSRDLAWQNARTEAHARGLDANLDRRIPSDMGTGGTSSHSADSTADPFAQFGGQRLK